VLTDPFNRSVITFLNIVVPPVTLRGRQI